MGALDARRFLHLSLTHRNMDAISGSFFIKTAEREESQGVRARKGRRERERERTKQGKARQ